jgi:hypothetical protein
MKEIKAQITVQPFRHEVSLELPEVSIKLNSDRVIPQPPYPARKADKVQVNPGDGRQFQVVLNRLLVLS